MITWFLLWLIAVEVSGAAVLPLAVRLLRPLPDRGYILAKPLGILVVGYICWFLGVLGILRYQQGTILVIALVVASVCWAAWGREALKQLSGSHGLLAGMEAVFLIALAGAALVRAYTPEISGTEKPMDFAILNAIYRTETLPPEDPWLSGYGISYYYFGYFLLATLAKLSTVPASVAYNLGVALVFALLLAGTFSIAFSILSALRPAWRLVWRFLGALLAPVIVGLMGNLEVGLEVLATKGYDNPAFWAWAGVKNLQLAVQPEGWFPSAHWWWWRASRVIPTTQPDGINEFPYFSYLLGDLHPHYTALPWVLLCVGLALAVILARTSGDSGWTWTGRITVALALGFLLVGNSWDFPAYTGLYWLAVLFPLSKEEWSRDRLVEGAKELLAVSILSIALFLPFFLGFSSQTKGIGLSADRTPLASMLIIFGAVFLILTTFLVWRTLGSETGNPPGWRVRVLAIAGCTLVVASVLFGSLPLLLGIVALGVAALLRLVDESAAPDWSRAAAMFQLLLAGTGLVLILAPEFVFLNDLFGTRMNTVFKFHYQAWVLLGIAASVAAAWLAAELRPLVLKVAVVLLLALPVGIGLLYPVAATPSKAQDFKADPTLDGAAFYRSMRPDDSAAIQWLSRNAIGRQVVLEATGGPYSEFARVSTFSGLPTVLGWGAHEAQWGRRGEELQRRAQDIDAVYSGAPREAVVSLLAKYRVKYVFVGILELEKYGPAVAERFTGVLEPAFRQGRVAVYRVP